MIKALMVEDSPIDAEFISKILKGVCDITHSESLQGCKAGDYDVILLDLSLPDSSPETTIEECRKRFPYHPIIVISGLEEKEANRFAFEQGADYFFPKSEYLRFSALKKNSKPRKALIDAIYAAIEARRESIASGVGIEKAYARKCLKILHELEARVDAILEDDDMFIGDTWSEN